MEGPDKKMNNQNTGAAFERHVADLFEQPASEEQPPQQHNDAPNEGGTTEPSDD
jgi:hypothetical protein